jgi:hypothetical protein
MPDDRASRARAASHAFAGGAMILGSCRALLVCLVVAGSLAAGSVLRCPGVGWGQVVSAEGFRAMHEPESRYDASIERIPIAHLPHTYIAKLPLLRAVRSPGRNGSSILQKCSMCPCGGMIVWYPY